MSVCTTVNSPIHGKVVCQILRARIPALNLDGNITWGDRPNDDLWTQYIQFFSKLFP